MLDYNGFEGRVLYLNCVTGEGFQQVYNEMSASKDKLVIASTILPFGGDSLKIQCWIFYKIKPNADLGKDSMIKPTAVMKKTVDKELIVEEIKEEPKQMSLSL